MQTQSHIPNLFDSYPYYDDYSLEKGFLKALFKPGYAVQARELTQIQTLLQAQIERFGSHVFEEGSVVLGGEIFEGSAHFIRVRDNIENIDDLVGRSIKIRDVDDGTTNPTLGTVIYVLEELLDGDDNQVDEQIVIYQPHSVGQPTVDDTITTFGDTDEGSSTITFQIAVDNATPPVAKTDAYGTNALQITVSEGVFYTNGYFVYASTQTEVPYNVYPDVSPRRILSDPTASVGFKVTRDILNATQDETLRDPAAGFYNFNAPGSDRYKITLSLASEPFAASIGDASSYTPTTISLELIRVVDGYTTKKVLYSEYAELEETFARRTYDESGHYTTNIPKISVMAHNQAFSPSDETKFAIGINPYKAYVSGFEVDSQSIAYLAVDKAREKSRVIGVPVNTEQGNYFIIDPSDSDFTESNSNSDYEDPAWRFTRGDKVAIENDNSAIIGHCTTAGMRKVSSNFRLYVTDVQMEDGEDISTAGKLEFLNGNGVPATPSQTIMLSVDSNDLVGPYQPNKRSLLFPVGDNVVVSEDGIADIATGTSFLVVQKHDSVLVPDDDTEFVVESPYQIIDVGSAYTIRHHGSTENSRIDTDATFTVINPNTLKVTLSSGSTGPSDDGDNWVSVYYTVRVNTSSDYGSSTNFRQKEIEYGWSDNPLSSGETVDLGGDNIYVRFILTRADIIELTDVFHGGESLKDHIPEMIVDDGVRQYAYKCGEVLIPENLLSPDGGSPTTYSINAIYDYWKHTGNGPVVVDSYINSGVAYEDIPSFTDPDSGKFYRLQKYIDYRPVQSRPYGNSVMWAQNNPYAHGLPAHEDESISLSYNSYVGRTDTIIISGENRALSLVSGTVGSLNETPAITSNDMSLYYIDIQPYVFELDRDVNVRFVNNNRFTMKQISEMKNENDVRYRSDQYNTMMSSALALSNNYQIDISKPIVDSILVDDFTGHAFADVMDQSHNCSMDTVLGAVRSPMDINVHDVQITLSGLAESDDGIITYPFTETLGLTQMSATNLTSTNPQNQSDWLGNVKIEPDSDFAFDVGRSPYVFVNSFGENNAYQVGLSAFQPGRENGFGTSAREWNRHWLGYKIETPSISIDPTSRSYTSPIIHQSNQYPNRILRVVGNKTVDESVTPYMREKVITFWATGMLSGSTVYAYFDSTLVGNADGYSVNDDGKASGTITLPGETFLSGEKTFRLIDRTDNNNTLAQTMAETKFYSQGIIETSDSLATSYKPIGSRRLAVHSQDVIDSSYESIQDDNYSPVVGGIEPFAQEIIIDPGSYPSGVFLSSIDLMVSTKPEDDNVPLTIQLRPMELGRPHQNKVIPMSTVSVNHSDVVTNGPVPITGKETTFTFSSPVYLAPGHYALCVISDKNFTLFSAIGGNEKLDGTGTWNVDAGVGVKLGNMFTPISTGERTATTNQYLTCAIRRCSFTTENGGYVSVFPLGHTEKASAMILTCNDQPTAPDSLNPTAKWGTMPIIFNNEMTILPHPWDISSIGWMKIDFPVYSNTILSPVIDKYRVGVVAIVDTITEGSASSSMESELIGAAGASSIACRYVSKRIEMTSSGNDIAVFLKAFGGKADGLIRVFVKTDSGGTGWDDDNNYIELFPHSDPNTRPDGSERTTMNSFKEYCFRPPNVWPNNPLQNFTTYSVKVVMMKSTDIDHPDKHDELPYVQDLRAVPMNSTA